MGPEALILPRWDDQQGGLSGEMAARQAAWDDLSKAKDTFFPTQAKQNRRASEIFSGTVSPGSVEAGGQNPPEAHSFDGMQCISKTFSQRMLRYLFTGLQMGRR